MAEDSEDPVARNRGTPRRHSPGRDPTGWPVTRRIFAATALAVVTATVVLVVVLAR